MQSVSENDVIAAIQKNTNCSISEAVAQISAASRSRLVIDNYMLYKDYTVKMDKNGNYSATYRHSVMVLASGSGRLQFIDKVYTNSVGVVPLSGSFSWESGGNYVNNWSSTNITFTSYGNAVLQTSYSIGVTVAGVVSYTASSNYFYRLPKTFKSSPIL